VKSPKFQDGAWCETRERRGSDIANLNVSELPAAGALADRLGPMHLIEHATRLHQEETPRIRQFDGRSLPSRK
jgi:hypothetical protein